MVLAAALLTAGALLAAGPLVAAPRDALGYRELRARLGTRLPVASGVPVAIVEGNGGDGAGRPAFRPDPASPELAGVRFLPPGPAPFSGHATGVALAFVGRGIGFASGVTDVSVWAAADWTGAGFLVPAFDAGAPPAARVARVANHSWVGDSPQAAQVLRRVDWLVDRDEAIQVVGVNNEGAAPALLAGAFNVIAVGRSAGSVSGTAPVDYLYTRERARPDLVVPVGTTSEATPYVAGAAAVLVGVGHDDASLSRDPQAKSTRSRAGAEIRNAERAEVIRAVLMAGAIRRTGPDTEPAVRGYRDSPDNRTRNGLDRRFGAGQLDLDASHAILTAGEQDSAEDRGRRSRTPGPAGFDYDPAFGGAGDSNRRARYRLPAAPAARELAVTLVWHLEVAGDDERFDGAARLYDLDLVVRDVTQPDAPTLAATSASRLDNTESCWVRVPAGRVVELEVTTVESAPFRRDYAIAWIYR